MRNMIVAAAIAGTVLVAAGFATTLISAPSVASAGEVSADPQDEGLQGRGFTFLSEVLSDLVSEGTINQSQSEAVLKSIEAKAAEVKAGHKATRELMKSLLEDGVLTREEASQLPEDHPLFDPAFDEAWADGELTAAEIRAIRPHPSRDRLKRALRLGALLDDGGIDQAEYDELMASLPEDHPLAQIDVSEYLSDGLITPDELREIFADNDLLDGRRPFGEGRPFGPKSDQSGVQAPA